MVDTEAEDIVEAIAARYLEIGCSVMTPNTKRIGLIERLIREYQIDGIVEIDLQACTPYTVEAYTIRQLALMVTHDVDEAILMSDRILFMEDKKIAHEVKVPFARPRNREKLTSDEAYLSLRRKVVDLFYHEQEQKLEFEGGEGI